MATLPSLVLLLLPCCLLHRAGAQTAREGQLLIRIKRAWGDPPVLAAWNSSSDHCTWPYVICDASSGRVTSLSLANACVAGSFPDAIGGLSSLRSLNLSNNHIAGAFPTSIYRCASLRHLDLSLTYLHGELPADIGNGVPLLQTMNLSGNQLSGEIPRSVAKLRLLTQLDLSKNQLAGEIPAELGAMRVLNALDLSSNKLSGDIPPPLAKLKLSSLNLSSNQLDGHVPAGLAIAAYDRSFLDNPGLCHAGLGPGYLTGALLCCEITSHLLLRGRLAGAPHWPPVAAGVLLVLIMAFAFFIVRDIRKRKRAAQDGSWKITPFQTLDFGEAAILRALTEENLVGSGGSGRVYRAAYTNRYNGKAGAAAVKKIRSAGKVEERLEREFESEASILGGVRHKNIVRLLCCLSHADSGDKLLVYDHMDNGSLDGWLHRHALPHGAGHSASSNEGGLDWPTRIRVAVGAAQGLRYLHHECSPPIVHRNVKTSNILLDSEFRTKVADFGLARMLVQAGTPDTMSAVAWSFGYMAPECANTTSVTEKVDVYSFGVVLLELGRAANDGGEDGSLAEWARRLCQSGGSIDGATDSRIRNAGFSEEIEFVFRLGLMCTTESPSSRPTMKYVLQKLLRCSEQTHQKGKVTPLLQTLLEKSDFDSTV
ncbi:receptor-like protein kinase HSL1 [Aegilops tauschii subsp. strangulata]|uniref:receptor-like protein kinase HSL1 n=1 Tax=Aegilops tauschii subsp. strangulata TaxID=200361 RepID=UPI001ABD10E9|nr:leucine-rich repeat receptor-like serine/threonine-protein kinase BAM2 [Aegilops tauschii subsp. strangulata]